MLGAGFNLQTFCDEMQGLLALVGWVLMILKLGIPLVIIALGIKDFGTAVIASKEDETKTAAKRLLWRFVAGVAIFFIPNIVVFVFNTISEYQSQSGSFEQCKTAILSPWEVD